MCHVRSLGWVEELEIERCARGRAGRRDRLARLEGRGPVSGEFGKVETSGKFRRAGRCRSDRLLSSQPRRRRMRWRLVVMRVSRSFEGSLVSIGNGNEDGQAYTKKTVQRSMLQASLSRSICVPPSMNSEMKICMFWMTRWTAGSDR